MGKSIRGWPSEVEEAVWRCHENLRNFRAQLGRERSEVRKTTLARLIAEEEQRLQELNDP